MIQQNNCNRIYNEKMNKNKEVDRNLKTRETYKKESNNPCYHHNRWFHQPILSEQTSKTQYQGWLGANNQENDH